MKIVLNFDSEKTARQFLNDCKSKYPSLPDLIKDITDSINPIVVTSVSESADMYSDNVAYVNIKG